MMKAASSSENCSNFSKHCANSGKEEKRCIICWKNESVGGGDVELPSKFLETLNLVWPWLEETMKQTTGSPDVKDKRPSEDGNGGCKFAEVPTICQGCADGIQSVQYFKGLSDRYLEQLKKSMEEAKTEAIGNGASLLSVKPKEKETPIMKFSAEVQQKPQDFPRATLIHSWKPKFLQNTSPSSSQDQSSGVSMETQQIERTTRGNLNKLTNSGHNFDSLTFKFVATLPFLKDEQDRNQDNQLIIKTIASLIFNKAVKEPFYCPAYARLVQEICEMSGKFRKFVLELCQSQFQQICEEAEVESGEEDEAKRQRAFGIVNFIQEISKFQLVTPKFLVGCLDMLLEEQRTVSQLKVECVYKFLAVEKFDGEKFPFGCILDVGLKALREEVKKGGGENLGYLPEDGWMDKLFGNLRKLSKNTSKFNGRIICLLENLVELRGNGWRGREKSSGIARKTGEVSRGKFAWKRVPPPNEEPARTLWLFERKFREILNKVNLKDENLFSELVYKFFKSSFWFMEDEKMDEQICKVGEMIFENGVKEPMFCEAYAKMIWDIGKFVEMGVHGHIGNLKKIREIVVERCIEEICKISGGDAHADHVEGEAEKFGKRERVLGVVKFIGELYRLEVFSSRNMATCMQYLIGGEINEVKMECVYRLLLCKFVNEETGEMVYYGEFLDVQMSVLRVAGEEDDEDVRWIEEMFGMVKKFGGDLRFGGRMRCLLGNLMELRDNGWKDKSQAVEGIAGLKEGIEGK